MIILARTDSLLSSLAKLISIFGKDFRIDYSGIEVIEYLFGVIRRFKSLAPTFVFDIHIKKDLTEIELIFVASLFVDS